MALTKYYLRSGFFRFQFTRPISLFYVKANESYKLKISTNRHQSSAHVSVYRVPRGHLCWLSISNIDITCFSRRCGMYETWYLCLTLKMKRLAYFPNFLKFNYLFVISIELFLFSAMREYIITSDLLNEKPAPFAFRVFKLFQKRSSECYIKSQFRTKFCICFKTIFKEYYASIETCSILVFFSPKIFWRTTTFLHSRS